MKKNKNQETSGPEFTQKILSNTEEIFIEEELKQRIDKDFIGREHKYEKEKRNYDIFAAVIEEINEEEIDLIDGRKKILTVHDWELFKKKIYELTNKFNEAVDPLSDAQVNENYFQIKHHENYIRLCRKIIKTIEQSFGNSLSSKYLNSISKKIQTICKYNYIMDHIQELENKKQITQEEKAQYFILQEEKEKTEIDFRLAYVYFFEKTTEKQTSILETINEDIEEHEKKMITQITFFRSLKDWEDWKADIYKLQEKYNIIVQQLLQKKIKIKPTEEFEYLTSLISYITIIENRYTKIEIEAMLNKILENLRIVCKYNYYEKQKRNISKKRYWPANDIKTIIEIDEEQIMEKDKNEFKQLIANQIALAASYEEAKSFLFGSEEKENKRM